MYKICKRFHFSAAHYLNGLCEGHPCARIHGHNYEVEIELQSATLDAAGFIRDCKELDALKKYIDDTFDHRLLNDVLGDHVSTESLAKHFYDWCKTRWQETSAIRIYETAKIWAEYRP